MQQRNWQLNNKKSAVYTNGHIFVSPIDENILFSCGYLKQSLHKTS